MNRRHSLCCLAIVFLSATALAGENAELRRTVSVAGTAVMYTTPDVIVWSLQTHDTDQVLVNAKAASDKKMKEILALQEELGIAPEDIQTGNLDARKVYNKDRSGNRTDFKYFAVSRSVTIKQRNLKTFDEFVAKLVAAADLDVSFRFESSRLHELRAETRLKALAAAKAKADAMTGALGAKCGPVLEIAEETPTASWRGHALSNVNYFDRDSVKAADVSGGTFVPGAIEVRISVNVVFEIE